MTTVGYMAMAIVSVLSILVLAELLPLDLAFALGAAALLGLLIASAVAGPITLGV